MTVRPLVHADLGEARELLAAALEHDRVAVVAEEKLFGSNGARTGATLGAWDGARLSGVAALAGRWLKLLAVAPDRRRRGVGTRLLDGARAQVSGKLRVGDHPGNYLSPGIDLRYAAGRAFFERHGLAAAGEVENLRAPILDGENPLVSEARARELAARAAERGYTVLRAAPHNNSPNGSAASRTGGVDRALLLDWIARAFAPVWAHEVARALDGPRAAVHVALHNNVPVAFAAADGNNQGLGWFGPAGTDPAHRGRGLGEALLIACLLDVRGLPDGGVIAWIGPKEFYRRACGAVEDRRFVQLEAAL